MILAETVPQLPTAMDWHGFGIVALFLLVGLEKVFGIGRWLRRDPEKREVTMSAQHPTKEEFEKLELRVADQDAIADEKREKFRMEVKDDIRELHTKVNKVGETVGREVSAVAAQCEMINSNLALLRMEVSRRGSERPG